MCNYTSPIGSDEWEQNLKSMTKKELVEYIKLLFRTFDFTPKEAEKLDNPLFKYGGL